jgi:hypothetical protein
VQAQPRGVTVRVGGGTPTYFGGMGPAGAGPQSRSESDTATGRCRGQVLS